MNFAIAFESVFQLTLGRLNEVSAAVAAAVGKGALDYQRRTPSLQGVPSTITSSVMAWIDNIIVILLQTRQTQDGPIKLERGCYRKPERLARLAQQEIRIIDRFCLRECVVARTLKCP